MATDRVGQTIAAGDLYALVGAVRKIETNDVVVVAGSRGQSATRMKPGDVVRIDEIPYCFNMPGLLKFDFTNPVTSTVLFWSDGSGSLSSSTYRMPVPRDCRAVDVAIAAMTLDEEPQTDWVLELYNESTKVATKGFLFGVSPTLVVSYGAWSVVGGQSLDFDAGDRLHMRASGTGQNAVALFVNHGWRTR